MALSEKEYAGATPRADHARIVAHALWQDHGAGYYHVVCIDRRVPPYVAQCKSQSELLRLCALAELEQMKLVQEGSLSRVNVVNGPVR